MNSRTIMQTALYTIVLSLFSASVLAGSVMPYYKNNEFNGNPNRNNINNPNQGTCNPINIGSGNKFHKQSVFRGGGEFPLEFDLYYNSLHYDEAGGVNVMLGQWTSTYFQKLVYHGRNDPDQYFEEVELIRADGQSMRFYRFATSTEYYAVVLGDDTDEFTPYGEDILGELSLLIDPTTLNPSDVVTDPTVPVYRYRSLDGVEEIYNVEGRLLSVESIHGQGKHQITYNMNVETYGGDNENYWHSMTVTNLQRQESMTIYFTGTNVESVVGEGVVVGDVLKRVVTPDQKVYNFTSDTAGRFYYNSSGQMVMFNPVRYTRITWPDNAYTEFRYNAIGFLDSWIYDTAVTVIDSYEPDGYKAYSANYTYDQYTGHATSSQHGSLNATYFYSGPANTRDISYKQTVVETGGHDRTVTNRDGAQTTYHFAGQDGIPRLTSVVNEENLAGNCVGSSVTHTYNPYLQLYRDVTTNTNTGLVVDYDIYDRGDSSHNYGVTGLPYRIVYKGVDDGEDRYVLYSWIQRKISTITTKDKRLSYTYEYGRVASLTETDKTIDPSGYQRTHSTERSWNYTYTYHDNDADGLHRVNTITEVDPRLNETVYTYSPTGDLVSITDALGHATTFAGHNEFGLPTSMVDVNGTVTTLSYSPRGWLETINTNGRITTLGYNVLGKVTSITLPNNSSLSYQYTDAGRLETVTNHLGETITINYVRGSGYEDFVTRTVNNGGQTRYNSTTRYDALGRLWKMFDLAGVSSEYNYDGEGNLERITDGLGGTIQNTFDMLGRIEQSIDNRDGTNISFGYDSQDNLTRVTNQRGHSTTYHYDGFGNLLSTTSPDTGTTLYYYDNAGNVTQTTNADNVTVTYGYDGLNRLQSIDYPSQEDVLYEHDATLTNGMTNYGVGRLTAVVKSGGDRIDWIYDEYGNITYDIRSIGRDSYTTAYAYGNAGELLSVTYPSGTTLSYDHVNGMVRNITYGPDSIASNITYEPYGPVTGFTYGNGLSMSHGYDSLYRTASIGTGDLLSLGYQYDARGLVENITDTSATPSRTQDFGYLTNGRLTFRSTSDDFELIGYDDAGSYNFRFSAKSGENDTLYMTPTNQWIDWMQDPNNAIIHFTWSASGNMTAEGTRSYIYNDAGRLIEVLDSGSTVASYDYNPLGQRDRKVIGNKTRHFIYNHFGQLLWEGTADGKWQRDYIYLKGRLISMVDVDSKGVTTLYYVHSDHLGSPLVISEQSGQVVWEAMYQSYGEVTILTETIENNIRFPGQYHDVETGLHYNYFRYYDPNLGRYITSDPIGLAGGLNTYAYVTNDPVNYFDPLGLFRFSDDVKAKYPKVVKYINSMKPTEEMIQSMMNHTGVERQDVIDAFTPGKGPCVYPSSEYGFGQGEMFGEGKDGYIRIGESTFRHGSSAHLDRVLGHETVHYLDFLDGSPQYRTKEPGDKYEEDIYGDSNIPLGWSLYYLIF